MLYLIASILITILFNVELNTASFVFALIAVFACIIYQFITDLQFNNMVHRMHGSHIAVVRIIKDLYELREESLDDLEEPDYGCD